jgi:hypothetical protein
MLSPLQLRIQIHPGKLFFMKSSFLLFLSVLWLFQPKAFTQSIALMSDHISAFNPAYRVESAQSNFIDWGNLQWPPSANIAVGGSVTVYSRCYEEGVTLNEGADDRISVWFGYSTTNTNPAGWTNWVKATYNCQYDWSDEYMASLGNTLPAGIYYYASRIQYDGGVYRFGGYNTGGGGFWDGVNNVSGLLTVGKQLATVMIGNTVQMYDGKSKQVTISTIPAGLPVQVLYDGSATLPVNAGSYAVTVTVNDAGYQGSQTGTLTVYTIPEDAISVKLRDKFIWVMYDQVYNQSDLDAAMSCKPDVINRGWFKWGNWGDFNWNQWSWMAQQANQGNALFGGGGTVMALYPGEVDDAKFQRIVDRTPLNKPMHFAGDTTLDYYNGDLQKKEYLDFLLTWIYKQIDAGANTLHLDGIAAGPSFGYSDYCMAQFDDYLINKYVDGNGWTLTDARWQAIFDISLASDCTDGTMNTFDYRKFLIRNGYDKDPFNYVNLLGEEFGYPWKYESTYADERNEESCRYLYESIKSYAAEKGLDVTVSTNGFSKYVDYQTTGVWSNWSVSGGKLDISPSYVNAWRAIKDYSLINLQHDIPLIVFHDWGYGMPFYNEIGAADQILWLRVYAPEVFASGAVFAWPFSGGGNMYKPSKAVLDTMQSLIKWYDAERELYIGSVWIPGNQVNLKGQGSMVQTTLDQFDQDLIHTKRLVHVINKKLDGNRKLVIRKNFNIRISSGEKPTSVWAVSPDFSDYQKLDFTWVSDTAEVTVKSLDAYTVVVLDYQNKVPQKIYFNAIPEMYKGDPDYALQAHASSGLPVSFSSSNQAIATIVNGKVHAVAAGTCTIKASQAGDDSYGAAQEVNQKLTIHSISEAELTFCVSVPANTPAEDTVYIAGSFNNWDPGWNADGLPMTPLSAFEWEITMPFAPSTHIEFKFTRGNWSRVEKDSDGNEIPNRTYTTTGSEDTLICIVGQWADITTSVAGIMTSSQQCRLDQNFPNPFASRTMILYYVPVADNITLDVFDKMGSKVATLIKQKQGPGVYDVEWNAGMILPGIYFCELRTGQSVRVIKMMKLR